MKRDNVAFLLGGIAFGLIVGMGTFYTVLHQPELKAQAAPAGAMQQPLGPPAPVAEGATPPPAATAGAPMVARVRELRNRVEMNPRDLRAIVELANLYHDASMFPEAIGFYSQAIALDPDNANLITDLGVCHQGIREFERALELFAEANRKDPEHWQSLFNMAVVSGFNLGRFDEAERALVAMEEVGAPADRVSELRAAIEQAKSAS